MNDGKKYMDFMAKLQAGKKIVDEMNLDESEEENVISLTKVTRYDWKNKCGTSDKKCNCGPWKTHWENLVEEKFGAIKFDEQLCSNEGCPDKATGRKAEHGAHVFHSGINDRKEWIVPLCAKCNNSENTDPFDLRIGTILVRANKGETCEISK